MEIPKELSQAIENTSKYKISELIKPAQEISNRYRTQSGTGTRLLSTEKEAAAYAAARMPATYSSIQNALLHVLSLFEDTIESLLDIGAGTGAAMWAAESLINLQDIVCIEREDAMRNIGMAISQEGSQAIQSAKWIKQDIANEKLTQKADIVISSYVLNEMTEETRKKVIEKLWLASKKILLIVEPGTPKNFSQMSIVRQILIDNGAHIIAPCPHENQCPLFLSEPYAESGSNWCHFSSRVARSRTHKQLKDGDAPYEDEKFTYLAASRIVYSHSHARIIRHPIISSGYITLELCTKDGIKKTTISKKDGTLYKQARKAKTGDAIPLS